MSVQAPLQAPRRPAILSDAFHVACALAAGLIPLTVFVVLSYHQTIRRAEADLTEIAELALQLARDILQEAELELTRFVNVSGGRATPESERLLREIVYTDPYFREARIIDERGLLIYSTVATIDLPIEIPADQRADPGIESLQVVGLHQTPLMRKKSIVLALPTGGQGEVDLLVDPGLVSLFFHEVELGPGGYLALTGPKGRVLSVLGPPPSTEAIRALTPEPDRIRVTIHAGQTWAVAEVSRDWALRDWSANLLFSIPAAAAASAALAFILIRLIRRQTGLDHDLRVAIARGELNVEYQPIIDLDNGRCVAAEALLRWRHPVHGYVRPDVFIPIAEDTGLIGPLTEWLVRRVILEQRPVLDRFPDLRLSINCTSSLLVSRDLEQILRRDVVAPDLAANLVFEVTENVFLGQNATSAREAMSRLRARGFRFALDDFGAGYSSLGYLQRFEFEFLKIDRSFVQAIGSSSATSPIFDALVDLARKLDVVTVAEGVETEEQRRYVGRRGVSLAQGWLFAVPLPVGEFVHFLAGRHTSTPVEAMPSKPASQGSGPAMDERARRRTTGAGCDALWHEDGSSDPRQYAPAAARNAGPICESLGRCLPASGTILEIGSGTGQHVVAFAAAHPQLSWQPSDPDPEARASIVTWIAAAHLTNVRAPLDIDVTAEKWPRSLERSPRGIVCINLLHVAPWAACAGLMAGAGQLLERGAPLYLYGPFKQGGRHTAASNGQFDRYLRLHDPAWGVRDLEAVVECAADHGLDLLGHEPMPANNLSLILRRH